MSNRWKVLVLNLIVAASCLSLSAQTYTLQAIPVPYAPNSNSRALGINNRGAVVGYFYYKGKNVVGGLYPRLQAECRRRFRAPY